MFLQITQKFPVNFIQILKRFFWRKYGRIGELQETKTEDDIFLEKGTKYHPKPKLAVDLTPRFSSPASPGNVGNFSCSPSDG